MPGVREAVRLMRESGVELGRGMGEGELSLAEASCNVRFPRTYRALLSAALPLAEAGEGRFPDWRDLSPRNLRLLRAQLCAPAGPIGEESLVRWPRAWGARPLTADGRRLGLHRRLALAPRLVPLYLSRFVPEGCGDDPPVLSVSGRRVLCMATGLGDWAAREFRGVSPRGTWPGAPAPVPVWDDLMPAAGQPGGRAAVPAPPGARRAPLPAGAADVVRLMARAGVSLAPGLSRAELSAAERACGAPFPRSLRALLQGAMPASWQGRFPFPDWRDASDMGRLRLSAWASEAADALLWLGLGGRWPEGWGARPGSRAARTRALGRRLATAPRLVPVASRCYVPVGCGDDPPVISVWAGEVACLGESLGDWATRTFGLPWDASCLPVPAFPPVPFWGDLMLL